MGYELPLSWQIVADLPELNAKLPEKVRDTSNFSIHNT